MSKLTNKIIDESEIKTSDYRLTDGSGLTIIIRKNGNKHWQFRYHVYEAGKRKERIYSLGEYPTVSIEQARTEHTKLKDKLSNGIDIQIPVGIDILSRGSRVMLDIFAEYRSIPEEPSV